MVKRTFQPKPHNTLSVADIALLNKIKKQLRGKEHLPIVRPSLVQTVVTRTKTIDGRLHVYQNGTWLAIPQSW